MEHFDEIASYLDVENSITVRWLANTLGIDLQNARSSMDKYKKANQSVAVSYLVVGTAGNGGLSYVVATESELDSIRSTFSPVRSEELYSIHKVPSAINRAEIQALEYEQASEMLLMSHPHSQEFISNVGGYITCTAIDVKPVGQRILSSNHSSQVSAQAKETIKTSVSKSIAEKPNLSAISSAPSSTSAAAAAPAVLKSKSSIQATNFFAAKSAPAPAKPTPTAPIEVAKETKAALSALAVIAASEKEAPPQKRVGKISMDDDEDEEWDAGYKPDPERLKERVDTTVPARAVISTGSEEMDLSEDADEDALGADSADPAAKKKSKGKGKVVLHGAMDDYMEDVAIAEHKRVEANPDAPKPKKRKLVEKVSYPFSSFFFFSSVLVFSTIFQLHTHNNFDKRATSPYLLSCYQMFADEKGYLVTEMVWEEVTDDESDAPVAVAATTQPPAKRQQTSAAPEKKASAPAGKAAAGKKGASEAPKTQQKSMMSFFGKKAE